MLSPASLRHQTDERLVSLARSGSERAWSEIMRRYRPQLRSYSARFVGPGRAEDAVQQTFLQAFLALRDSQPREIALRAWLYRIAHNCSVDVLRKGAWDHEQLDLEYDGVPQPPMLFEQKEEIRGLVASMRALPDAQRQALALRELEGRSYEEISSRLGHSGSGVRQLIFRARTTLRNGVGAILPFGALRARFSQPGAVECHHIANAVSAPASSGGGLDTAGAAALAVVAVLGGGVVATGADSKRARHAPRTAVASPPEPAAPRAQASAPAGRPQRPAGRTGGFTAKLSAPPAVVGPNRAIVEALAPPAPADPGVTGPVTQPESPAAAQGAPGSVGAPAGAGTPAEDTRQQSTAPSQPSDAAGPPASTQPASGTAPAPSEGTDGAPPPASPGTPAAPAAPQSGAQAGGTAAPGRAPGRPPKPAPKPAPRKPLKPQSPKAQAPKQPPKARPAPGKSDKSGRR
jgi:RNA polymerase sigma factor (sigma-70 family)